ncbi:Development-specific protein S [compost metagenome]
MPVGNYTLDQLKSYGIVNDDLSSVRLENGYKITMYQNDNFGGESVVITGNNGCLGNFNDKASSVKISVL